MTQKHQLRFQSHVFSNSKLAELEKNIVQPNTISCHAFVKIRFFVLVVLHVVVSKARCPVFSRVIKFFL